MARVVIEKLTRFFAGPDSETIRAVDDLTLTIEDKELLVIVGPSGCGKTTTLRLIAGLEKPTRGTIAIDGKVQNEVPPKDRDIAMVFQHYALYPHMSVYENISFGLRLRKLAKTEIERRVRETVEMLDLAHCLDRMPDKLSGGQRQRVALGRAIVRRPRLLLLDEPLASLDARLRGQMRAELCGLQAQLGLTMLYVTHDQTEAMALGNRIAVLSQGTLQQLADPIRLYEHPGNKFVAGFFGSLPMNFFEGTILKSGSGLFFKEEEKRREGEPAKANNNGCLPLVLILLEESCERMQGYAGKRVVLGIRPEDIKTSPEGGRTDFHVEAIARRAELFGSETHLHLASTAHSFIARVPGNNGWRANQRVSLLFDMRHAHFFDVATKERIGA